MSPTAGAFGLAVESGRERPTTFVVFDPTVESVAEDIRTVKTLLGLDQEPMLSASYWQAAARAAADAAGALNATAFHAAPPAPTFERKHA
jgi:hypothetical protein